MGSHIDPTLMTHAFFFSLSNFLSIQAVIGPLPPDFLRLQTPQDIQEAVSDVFLCKKLNLIHFFARLIVKHALP